MSLNYIKANKISNETWYMHLNLKMSICIVATIHLMFLYIFCNGIPLTLWNVVWEIQGLRPIPL